MSLPFWGVGSAQLILLKSTEKPVMNHQEVREARDSDQNPVRSQVLHPPAPKVLQDQQKYGPRFVAQTSKTIEACRSGLSMTFATSCLSLTCSDFSGWEEP